MYPAPTPVICSQCTLRQNETLCFFDCPGFKGWRQVSSFVSNDERDWVHKTPSRCCGLPSGLTWPALWTCLLIHQVWREKSVKDNVHEPKLLKKDKRLWKSNQEAIGSVNLQAQRPPDRTADEQFLSSTNTFIARTSVRHCLCVADPSLARALCITDFVVYGYLF